jgi:hypothetical protein
MFELTNPTLNLGAIVGGDVLPARQVFPQVGKGRINLAQVVVAGAQVAHEYQQVRVGNAQVHQDLGRFFVATRFVKPHGLFDLGLALLVEFGSRRRPGQHG